MKNLYLVGLVLFSFIFTSCEAAKTDQNSANNPQNQNTVNETISEKSFNDRHVRIKSEKSFDETYAALKKAIESKEPLSIVAELDHQANAKKVGLDLRPTKVIMFGNPKLGTPLMKENQAIGVDLPQKMLVYEDEKGDIFVVYNDPKALAENHDISGEQDEILNKISAALKGLAETATKKGEN